MYHAMFHRSHRRRRRRCLCRGVDKTQNEASMKGFVVFLDLIACNCKKDDTKSTR